MGAGHHCSPAGDGPGHVPRAQHFGGAKLRSEFYALITRFQMSADVINYDLQNVECQRLLPVMEETFIEVGGPSAWCEGNHFKVGGPGPGNENFLAELSQSLEFLHIWLSEVDGPVPTGPRIPPSMTATQLQNLVKIIMVRKASSYER